ncbi:MAG: hypothetical protein M3Q23_02565 [Actinomycetota bacterium]|nr:hypothetical protein [Actinomycetota bacterium]
MLIDSSDGEKEWTTVGVSGDIIEASWRPSRTGLAFGLLHPRTTR